MANPLAAGDFSKLHFVCNKIRQLDVCDVTFRTTTSCYNDRIICDPLKKNIIMFDLRSFNRKRYRNDETFA